MQNGMDFSWVRIIIEPAARPGGEAGAAGYAIQLMALRLPDPWGQPVFAYLRGWFDRNALPAGDLLKQVETAIQSQEPVLIEDGYRKVSQAYAARLERLLTDEEIWQPARISLHSWWEELNKASPLTIVELVLGSEELQAVCWETLPACEARLWSNVEIVRFYPEFQRPPEAARRRTDHNLGWIIVQSNPNHQARLAKLLEEVNRGVQAASASNANNPGLALKNVLYAPGANQDLLALFRNAIVDLHKDRRSLQLVLWVGHGEARNGATFLLAEDSAGAKTEISIGLLNDSLKNTRAELVVLLACLAGSLPGNGSDLQPTRDLLKEAGLVLAMQFSISVEYAGDLYRNLLLVSQPPKGTFTVVEIARRLHAVRTNGSRSNFRLEDFAPVLYTRDSLLPGLESQALPRLQTRLREEQEKTAELQARLKQDALAALELRKQAEKEGQEKLTALQGRLNIADQDYLELQNRLEGEEQKSDELQGRLEQAEEQANAVQARLQSAEQAAARQQGELTVRDQRIARLQRNKQVLTRVSIALFVLAALLAAAVMFPQLGLAALRAGQRACTVSDIDHFVVNDVYSLNQLVMPGQAALRRSNDGILVQVYVSSEKCSGPVALEWSYQDVITNENQVVAAQTLSLSPRSLGNQAVICAWQKYNTGSPQCLTIKAVTE